MLNVISPVIIKKIAIEYAWKEVRREWKCFTAKISTITQNKTVMQEMRGKAIGYIENK